MTVISVTELTYSPSKRRTNISQLLPFILLFLASAVAVFPLLCVSLKISDGPSFHSRRNNGAKIDSCPRRRKFSVEPAALTKTSSLRSSQSPSNTPHHYDETLPSNFVFPTHRPLLAIITETDACDTEEKMIHAYGTVKKATSAGKVDLVSVRLSLPPRYDENGDENCSYDEILERASRLTKELVALSLKQKEEQQLQIQNDEDEVGNTDTSQQLESSFSFMVVCSSDLVSVAVSGRANGVHVKEHHLDQLPDIVRRFEYPIVIGTSTHSVESALRSYFCNDNSDECVQNFDEDGCTKKSKIPRPIPHYYFVGTCFMTASHPEKTLQSQLEGPELPGKVKQALLKRFESKQEKTLSTMDESHENLLPKANLRFRLPRIMAIGGIDETNCHEPVELGADGVAVIRAVLQADHPIERVEEIQSNMMRSFTHYQ